MEIKEFIEKFAGQFEDTDSSIFMPDTKFKEIEEWSSLTALSIIAMIDEEYDITLTGEDIRKSETVEDIYNLVSQKL